MNGSVETGVGNAANIHLAASTEVVTFGCVVPVSTPKGAGKRESPAFTTRTISLRKGLALAMAIFWFRQNPASASELDEDKLKHYRLDS